MNGLDPAGQGPEAVKDLMDVSGGLPLASQGQVGIHQVADVQHQSKMCIRDRSSRAGRQRFPPPGSEPFLY